MEKSVNLGMQTFDQALYDLYCAGKISLDVALKNADSANNLRLRIKLEEEGGAAGRHGIATSAEDSLKLQVDSS